MELLYSPVILAAGTMSQTYSLLYIICLVLGIVCFALAVLFFFVFDIPGIFRMKTGKGIKQQEKRMAKNNSRTARLRKTAPSLSQTDVNEAVSAPRKIANPVTPPPAQQMSNAADAGTTVLGQVETTFLRENETTVLDASMSGEIIINNNKAAEKKKRSTTGRFDISYELMMIHTDEFV